MRWPVTVAFLAVVVRVLIDDVTGLLPDTRRIPEVGMPRERMNRRALQQLRQLLSPQIGVVDLLPAISLCQRAGQDDLVMRPVWAAQVQHRELESLQPVGHSLITSAG